MDVDRAGIEWCSRHITPRDERFEFYHADCRNPSYNPKGFIDEEHYRFSHADSSFDLILLTSVFTHVLEAGFRNYMREIARLLAPRGVVYATVFFYPSQCSEHDVVFQDAHGHFAVGRDDRPTDAVAYRESFVREVVKDAGLSVVEPIAYGSQDVLLLTKTAEPPIDVVLGEGWYPLEKGIWRWTEQSFTVNVKLPSIQARTVQFRFHVPAGVLQELGSIRLSAVVADSFLPGVEVKTAGDHIYSQPLPPHLPASGFNVRFLLDKTFRTETGDVRELGIQVPFFAPCGAGFRALDPIRVE